MLSDVITEPMSQLARRVSGDALRWVHPSNGSVEGWTEVYPRDVQKARGPKAQTEARFTGLALGPAWTVLIGSMPARPR